MSVETVVEAIATEAKEVATEAVAEVKEVVAEVKAEVKAAVVQVSTDEKLFLREAELEYLKVTMEIQRLTKITEAKSKEYQSYVEEMFKKYLLDKAEYIFDGGINAFKKL